MFDPQEFSRNLVGGGASPTKFEVFLTPPAGLGIGGRVGTSGVRLLAKGASLPGIDVGVVRVNYKGREVKFAGESSFSDWTIRLINDEGFNVRDMFVAWMNKLNGHRTNLRDTKAVNLSDYSVTLGVKQYSKSDDVVPIKVYLIVGAFPTSVSAIEVNWDQKDTIEEFSVTFQYQYWTEDFNSASNPIE